MQPCVHAFTTSFSFLLRRSGSAPLGVSTAYLILSYMMAFCWVWAEHGETPRSAQRAGHSEREAGSPQEGAWVAVPESCRALLLERQSCCHPAGRGAQKACWQA